MRKIKVKRIHDIMARYQVCKCVATHLGIDLNTAYALIKPLTKPYGSVILYVPTIYYYALVDQLTQLHLEVKDV